MTMIMIHGLLVLIEVDYGKCNLRLAEANHSTVSNHSWVCICKILLRAIQEASLKEAAKVKVIATRNNNRLSIYLFDFIIILYILFAYIILL